MAPTSGPIPYSTEEAQTRLSVIHCAAVWLRNQRRGTDVESQLCRVNPFVRSINKNCLPNLLPGRLLSPFVQQLRCQIRHLDAEQTLTG